MTDLSFCLLEDAAAYDAAAMRHLPPLCRMPRRAHAEAYALIVAPRHAADAMPASVATRDLLLLLMPRRYFIIDISPLRHYCSFAIAFR